MLVECNALSVIRVKNFLNSFYADCKIQLMPVRCQVKPLMFLRPPGDVMYTGSPEGVSEVKAGDELHFVCDQIGEFKISVGA